MRNLKERFPDKFKVQGGEELAAFFEEVRKDYSCDVYNGLLPYYYSKTDIDESREEGIPKYIGCAFFSPAHSNLPEYTVQQLRDYYQKSEIDIRGTKIWFGNNKELGKQILLRLKELNCVIRYGSGYDCYTEGSHLYIDKNNIITYGGNSDYFKKNENKEITPQDLGIEMKKIIGYKAPYSLLSGSIEKGTMFIVADEFRYKPESFPNIEAYELPKEIVEQWEAVFEKETKIVIIGKANPKTQCEVTISNKIVAAGKEIKESDIFKLFNLDIADINNWGIVPKSFNIGCVKNVTLDELAEVLDTYNKLNNK